MRSINFSKMPKGDYKFIAAGFREDLTNLIDKFVEKKSFELKEFAEIWRSLYFSLIFLGREKEHELKEFTEEAFRITVEHLESTNTIYRNVAIIYALYGLYLKQRIEPKVKIRIDVEHMQVVLNVLKYGVKNNCQILCFVINFLMFKPAFNYVACPKLMGPYTTAPQDPDEELHLDKIMNLKEDCEEFVKSGIFESLSNIHEKYIEAKKKILSNEESNLGLVSENKYDAALRHFKTLLEDPNEGYIQNNLQIDEIDLENLENKQDNSDFVLASSSKHTEDIGARRAQIKQAQFAKSITSILSGKEEQTSSDDEVIPLFSKMNNQQNKKSVITEDQKGQNYGDLFIDEAFESDQTPRFKKRGRKPRRRRGKVGRPKKEKPEPKEKNLKSDESSEDEQATTEKRTRPIKHRYNYET